MERHRKLVVEQASIVHFQESQKLRALAEMNSRERQDEYLRRRWLDVQRWLSAYNSTRQQEICISAKSECPGSGQWLLTHNQFAGWSDLYYCRTPLLWLNGIPGAGKTVLTSTVVETIQTLAATNDTVRLAYFYCKNGDENRNTFVSVARGLLSQLLRGNSDLVLHLYEKGNLQSGEVILLDRAMTKDLLEVATVDHHKTTYIIIDGIDECGRDERKEICSWFCGRVNRLPQEDFGTLRCLFISQEDGVAKKDLGMVPSIKMLPMYTRDDIKRYVALWHKKIEDKHGKLDPDKYPLTDIIMSSTQGIWSIFD